MTERQIRILPEFTGYREGMICFETRCGPEDVYDIGKYAFEHHGPQYSPFSPGALRLFYERLVLGQPMPPVIVLTAWHRYDQIMAAAMFIHPPMALDWECGHLVNSLDALDRLGPAAFAHMPHDHKELVYAINGAVAAFFEQADQSDARAMRALAQCAGVLIDYVENGAMPPVASPPPVWEVLADDGEFVAFTSQDYVWDIAYQAGYTHGLWAHGNALRLSRKSPLVPCWDPPALCARMAAALGGEWRLDGDDVVGEGDAARTVEALRAILAP